MKPEPLTCLGTTLARAALLLVLMTGGAAGAEQRFAVLIGANVGWANDRPLRYAEADAERMRDVLVELGGFSPDRVWLLRDPHTDTIRAHLERLSATLRMLGKDSLVVFYYSGHADARHLHLRGPPLSYQELRLALDALPATVRVGVLDACRSGSIVAPKGGTFQTPFQVELVDELRVRGLALLTSSGADELAQEARALAGSVFTHHLLSGMRGAADLDGDGAVGLSEAWRYALQHTEVDTATMQVPHRPAFHFKLEGQGEPLLTRQTPTVSRLRLPRGEGARYVVTDEHEARLVAEAPVRPDAFTLLALAPGRYTVKRVEAERLEVAALLLKPEQEQEASALEFASRPLAEGLLKGRPDAQDAEGLREWRRGEALRLLAVGEAGAALVLFEELLARWPEDPGALRGKARALVRMAEAYDRLGSREQEQEALQSALATDGSLAQDPDFASWLRRLEELQELQRKARLPRLQATPQPSAVRWGVGLELVGNRGMLAVSGRLLIQKRYLALFSVDALGPGVGLGIRRFSQIIGWNTYVGAGVHLPFSRLGLPSRQDTELYVPLIGPSTYQAVWGTQFHVEVGKHYLSYPGFVFEWNLGLVGFEDRTSDSWRVAPMVGIGVGWYFKRG